MRSRVFVHARVRVIVRACERDHDSPTVVRETLLRTTVASHVCQNFKRFKREADKDAGERPFGECDLDFIPMTCVRRIRICASRRACVRARVCLSLYLLCICCVSACLRACVRTHTHAHMTALLIDLTAAAACPP